MKRIQIAHTGGRFTGKNQPWRAIDVVPQPRNCRKTTSRHWLCRTRLLASIFIFAFLPFFTAAQENSAGATVPDTLSPAAVTDTSDTLQTLTPPPESDVEGPVKYWAEDIEFSLDKQTTHLKGNAKIVYLDITLTAAKIDIDWTQNIITAEGIADSTDSLGNPVYKDLPVLTEKGEEPIEGEKLSYDFKHNRGKILQGRTNMNPGYYRGEDIRKIGQETLLIEDGYFTSCDLEDHPHFYFRSKKMRVRLKKQAVAKPVYLYIADVPIMAVPFAVFSLRRGRRSGIILPSYGESSFGGRYLKDFGYYWAPSQYWDATLQATFYEKTGLLYKGDLRYKKRYAFNGRVNGNFSPKDVRTGVRRERWELNFDHFQRIGQTLTISGNGSFVSDKNFLRDYNSDFERRTNQNLTTNVSVKKTFPGSRILSLNLRRNENLQTERIDYDFPDLFFSQPSRSLFPRTSGGAGAAWYNNIKYSYSSNLKSSGSRIPVVDSTGQTIGFDRPRKSGWQHNLNPTFSTKVLKYFNFTPSISFQELWVPEYLEYRFVDSLNALVADTVQEFRSRHTFSNAGFRTNTTLYGLWEIPFSPLKVIRHKIDPSIGFRYQPDFSQGEFGYVQTFRDTTGRKLQGDRFAGNVFGSSTPRTEQRSMTIDVNNLFQGKILHNGEEKKIDLFRLNFSTAHNFAADSLRWSNLRTTFQAKPHPKMNLSMNARHSFYKPRSGGGGRRDEFVWSDGFALPSLLDWNMNMSFGFNIKPPGDEAGVEEDTLAGDTLGGDLLGGIKDIDAQNDEFENFQRFKIPWNVDVNFTYSYSDNGRNVTQRFDARISARMSLTENWNITYRNHLNLKERDIVNQQFSIARDLHCWQLNFEWSPNPNYSYYRLEIRVKEAALRDLKVTKTASNQPLF